MTVKGLRYFQRSCLQDPSVTKIKKLIRANEILLARTSIAEHRARNLQQALQIEKKKRKRGTRLNLAGDETSHGQWFGAPEIMRARAKLEEKTAQEEALIAEKVQKKTEKEDKKRQQEQERAVKALQRDIKRQAKEEEKAEKARAAVVKKTANKKLIKPKKSAKKACIIGSKPKKAVSRSLVGKKGVQGVLSAVKGEMAQMTSKSGRKIALFLQARQ